MIHKYTSLKRIRFYFAAAVFTAVLFLCACGQTEEQAITSDPEETAFVAVSEPDSSPVPSPSPAVSPSPSCSPVPQEVPDSSPEPESPADSEPSPEPSITPQPGPWCLEELGIENETSILNRVSLELGNIAFPKPEYYLDHFKTMYVYTENAHIFAFPVPWIENWAKGLAQYNDEVTVIAEYRGWSCCLIKDGTAGWIASDHLSKYISPW